MHRWVKHARNISVATGVAMGMVTLSGAPAFAGTNASLSTSYYYALSGTKELAGSGWFYNVGDHWKACDRLADGDRVIMTVYWEDSSGNHQFTASDTDGANGTADSDCATGTHNIPEGTTVTLRLWHQDGADGIAKDIDYGSAVA